MQRSLPATLTQARPGPHSERELVVLCQDPDKNIKLAAIKVALLLMHARPTPIVIPIASDMQLSFLPADPMPEGNIYEGEALGG